jgi:hypothetical protein
MFLFPAKPVRGEAPEKGVAEDPAGRAAVEEAAARVAPRKLVGGGSQKKPL